MEYHKVTEIRYISNTVFVLCFERKDIQFIPGQHLNVGLPGEEDRPYSIYSGYSEEHLEILVKEVEHGNISRKLKLVEPGDLITVDVPTGYFTIEEELKEKVPFWFIGTGTGISPFHCFVMSYKDLDYRIVHGIKAGDESFWRQDYEEGRYISCTSRDSNGDFSGRITEYLRIAELDSEASYLVCGGYEMIDQVFDLLISKGISKFRIKTEGYF
jgi:ferredoxin/flavodoxin---NADP+ reductase